MQQKKYFNSLDFFKFIFSLTILLFHLRLFVPGPRFVTAWDGNYIVVDFFFMVSGFLLFFYPQEEKFGVFFKKRYFRLAPLTIFQVAFIDFIYPKIIKTDILLNIFFLNPIIQQNFYFTWFIPCLFWGNLFYFHLREYSGKRYCVAFISLIVYICYSFVLNANNYSLDATTRNISYIFNIGLLRGIAGIGLGYLLAIYTSKKKLSEGFFKTLLYSISELLLLFLIINKLFMYKKMSYLTDVNMLFAFSGLIILFTQNRGVISKLLNKLPWYKVSKFNFSIYVMQFISFKISEKLFPYISSKYNIFHEIHDRFYFTFTFSIFLGILMYYLLEKPIYSWSSKKILKVNDVQ